MKTVLSVLCWLGIVVMLTGCDNGDDDSGTAGGYGAWPEVSFAIGDNGTVICYNADSNVITTKQICTWNCALYESNQPRYVKLTFDETQVCEETATASTSDSASYTNDYSNSYTSDGTAAGTDQDYTQDSDANFDSEDTSGTSTTCSDQFGLAHEYTAACVL